MIGPKFKASSVKPGVWSPGSEPPPPPKQPSPERGKNTEKDGGGIPPVWTPSSTNASPVAERKEFRPVSFESPILSRRIKPQNSTDETSPSTTRWSNDTNDHQEDTKKDKDITSHNIAHNITSRIVNSHSVPSQGLNTLATTAPRLPRAQNPTITLLQKAREGQLPKGAAYLYETVDFYKNQDNSQISPNEINTEAERSKKMANLNPKKVEGIGPVTKNGMPVALRSEVKENNQAKWYKQMYDSLHRAGKDDDYVTIRYKPRRGTRYGYGSSSGYLSEPEPRAYIDRAVTLDTRRRQKNKENDSAISTMPRKSTVVKTTAEVYHNQPGRIEDYEPGRSSIGEKETKEAEEKQSQLQHPMALRTFIPTHQLVRTSNNIQSTTSSSSSSPTTTITTMTTTTTQSLHPKSSLRTTRAVLEYIDPEIIETVDATARENRQTSLINLHLGRSIKSIIASNAQRMSYSLIKSPKSERGTSTKNRQRHSRENKSNRETHSDDAIVIGFIDETIKPKVSDDNQRQPLMLEERSKSFVMPNSISPNRRLSPLIGNRSSSTNKERTFLPMTSPRNHHRNHHHRQHHDPSISSSTSSSSSSTIHITMLPPPPPPPPITNNTTTTTTVIAETTLTSPLTSRPFDQRNHQSTKPYMSHALKESGYESDSTLIFRRRDDVSPLSPLEQRLAYKTVQKGGDVPLHGFRKLAPERPKDDTEIQYFPITSTLTRIRVRRKNAISSSATSGSMSSSLSFARSQKFTPSSTTSTIIPLSRANISSTIIQSSGAPPSPPRRQSSRHNTTLKLYISTRYPQTSNRRHEQCFAVESASANIRFLRERLSNKLLKHEQGREHSNIAHKRLTSLQNSSVTLASTTKTKLSTKSTSAASKRGKVDSYLSKRPQEYLKSVNSTAKICDSNQRIIDTKQKTREDKPSIVRVLSKTSLLQDTYGRSLVRSKSLQSCQKKDQTKNCKTKRDTVKSSKRGSSADSSLPAEVGRVFNSRRQVDVESTLTGSVIKSSSALRRVKSQDIGLSKVILKSRELKKTTTQSSPVRTGSPMASPISIIKRPTQLEVISKSKSLTPSKSRDKNFGVTSSVLPVFNDTLDHKKVRGKPHTIIKNNLKKSDTDLEDKQVRTIKKTESILKQEKTRETMKTRNLNGKIDCEKKTNKKTSEKSKINDNMKNIKEADQVIPSVTMERIKRHHETTRTDNFFQNLFLRNISSPTPSQCSTLGRRSSVMERARMFQELGNNAFKSEPSLRTTNVYLSAKRPVSNSRFKNWERESLSSRSSSPFGISWSGRSVYQKVNKFDSLHGMNEIGSCSSLRGRSPDIDNNSVIKERSLSEPPLKLTSVTNESTIILSHTPPRSPSPSPTRSAAIRKIRTLKQHEKREYPKLKTRAKSASEVEFNENQSTNLGSNLSLTKSTSSLDSPPTNRDDYQRYVFEMLHSKRKSARYRDLHDFYASLERMGELEKTTSTNDLKRRLKNEDIIDYDRWKKLRCKERAEVELNNLYGKLQAAQREKDFLFSTKDLARYRWKGDCGLRCKERSVENIRESFQRLEQMGSELELTRRQDIACKRDVYKPLWRGNTVVNVASTMTKRATANECKQLEDDKWSMQPSLQRNLGGSKKFWSSLSVEQVNVLKNQLNEIYGSDNIRGKISPKSPETAEKMFHQEITEKSPDERSKIQSEYEVIVPLSKQEFDNEQNEKKGLSVRCHSLISAEIKSSSKLSSSLKRSDSISNGRRHDKSGIMPLTELEKQRLSLTLGNEIMDKVLGRRNSKSPITPRETRGAIAVASAKSTTKNISHSISTSNPSPRTYYSFETSLDDDTLSKTHNRNDFSSVLKPKDDNNLINRINVEDFPEEWARKPPLLAMTMPGGNCEQNKNRYSNEIESTTESSENSVKTVVQCFNEIDVVPRKVEFFENIEKENYSCENKIHSSAINMTEKKSVLSSSQSFADLKELFGEMNSARYATLPFHHSTKKIRNMSASRCTTNPSGSEAISGKRARGGRSTSASPDVPSGRFSSASHSRCYYNDRPRSVSPCRVSSSTCSLESLRHRSISPDPERYWRTYLNLVKHGAVQKLRAKFESLEELSSDHGKFILKPKRFQSDPELTRNFLNRITAERISTFRCKDVLPDVGWLRRKYEPNRSRSMRKITRSPPIIPKIPLRLDDLAMPHINIISKTAELKDSTMSRSSSSNSLAIKAETEEIIALRPVGRIKEKFGKIESDKTSILGEMFTSAPNVHELRDISPYLAGRWVAHRYPNRRDNARSLSLPPDLENSGESKVRRDKMHTNDKSTLEKNNRDRIKESRTSSASPVLSQTPTSILKQRISDPFADQPFDASKHRPRYRYQPPPPPLPPAPTIRHEMKSWWPPIPTYTARPTVTFEGPR
ncbi:hypothetical protein PV325_005065 [Microctonus aethiopoides]|nr:hypothetical protein PV325_005065 [Microctonus aethiopoides]